ncbi:MAG TPA: alpha/beta hydrolase-fold protein [Mycobacteriales bacterium]|nr:alpha/beta hydrolase-fold protein [Mycobacteriales bacterium]HVU61169.1 alpha/beta hydrolase-fold protein [Mycobacteriales bacterium]
MRRTALLAAALSLAAAASPWSLKPSSAIAQSAQPRLVTITIPARHGHIPATWLPYPGPPRAAVLLPAGYDPNTEYPLVLNLGGLGGDYARAAFGPGLRIDAIVVTPEPGNGWYADWWNDGRRGAPAWETYYLDDVLPTILARYPIRPQRRFHAVVGISMGGLGATYLGGRLPGFFGSVASLSGFLDPQYGGAITAEGMGLASFAPAHGDKDTYPVLGPPDGFYAVGHNPTRLVANLDHTRVFATTGTGVPSSAALQADPAAAAAGGALEGPIIRPMNDLFRQAAEAAGVDLTYRIGPGGHDAPDFSREIAAMLAWRLFEPVPAHPRTWTNLTVATHGQLWDVGYRFADPPTRVVRFHRSARHLTISAAGSAVTITTESGRSITTATPATISSRRLTADRRAPRQATAS